MEQKAKEAAMSEPKEVKKPRRKRTTREPKIVQKEVQGEPMHTPQPPQPSTARMYRVRIHKTSTGRHVDKSLPFNTLKYIYPASLKQDADMRIELLEEVPGLMKTEKKPCKNC